MQSLFGNRVTEKDIRDWLSQNGYEGNSAKFAELELHAIQRPGWLQIFRFEMTVPTAEDHALKLWGAVREDERYGPPQVIVYEEIAARDEQLAEWSLGLITQRHLRR